MAIKRNFKYLKVYENFTDKIILYRGDSQKIDSFKDEFYDYGALLGAGLYLTDDYNKAKSYTTKGDSESVLADLEFDDLEYGGGEIVKIANPLQYAYNLFVQDYYCKNTDYSTKIGAYTLDELKKLDLVNFLNGYNLKPVGLNKDTTITNIYLDKYFSFISDDNDRNERIEDSKIEFKEFKNFINNIYIPAYIKFDKEKDKFDFLLKSYHGITHRYHVIDISKSKGHISKFEIDNNLMDKFIDVNVDINDIDSDVITAFKKVLSSTGKQYFIEKPFHKRNTWKYVSNYEYDNIFVNYFRGVKSLFNHDIKYLKLFYDKLINELKKLGYIGFKYNGGHLTGTDEHNAYVLWNLDKIKRIS